MVSIINLSKLRNAEFYQFVSDISTTLLGYNPVTLGINKPYLAFAESILAIDALLMQNRTSAFTEELLLLDERRDKAITGLVSYVESMTYHFDVNLSKKAVLLSNQLKTYGTGIAKQNYQTETATITNIVRDWDTRADYTEAIMLLNLVAWKEELSQANILFNVKYLERAKDDAENISSESMKNKRLEVGAAYQKLKTTIESVYTIKEMEGFGHEILDTVIKNLNVIIEKYNILLAGRGGK